MSFYWIIVKLMSRSRVQDLKGDLKEDLEGVLEVDLVGDY